MKIKYLILFVITILIISSFTGCIDDNYNFFNSDLDKDGVPDHQDAFPNDSLEQYDSDNDGVGDNSDKFLDDPSASIDSDNDGFPDSWIPGKNQSHSTSIPPLELDDFPFDPEEWIDSDNDGIGDNRDEFPDDTNEWKDEDFDGVGDNSDINSNVDLSLEITIEKFKVTSRVDILGWAQIYLVINIDGIEFKRIDNDGTSWKVDLNEEKKVDQSFYYNIPDNTNKRDTIIEIIMFDSDFFFSDDIVDISDNVGAKTIFLRFDNVKNSVTFDKISKGSQGTVWYDIEIAEEVVDPDDTYKRTYSWEFDDKDWELKLEIPVDIYDNYRYADVDRRPQYIGIRAMASFVTADEKVIIDTASELEPFIESEKFDKLTAANFILKFVQKNIRYSDDNDTKGCVEYWRYPVETLVDKKGDCEDTSVLYASFMKALDFDVVLLFYILDDDLGHLSVGIQLSGNPDGEFIVHKGKRYYYCETTTLGYDVGEVPPDIEEKPDSIISL